MINPMTVAELIERLQKVDGNTLVMIECSDRYYSGPFTRENITMGEVQRSGPFTWTGPSEDAHGHKIKPRIGQSEGGWFIDEYDIMSHGEILERRPCLIINATG